MHLLKTSFNSNPNVGLYGFATDKYCLLSPEVNKKLVEQIGKMLKVPIHQMNICGTSLLGAFLSGNSNSLLVPSIAFDSELEKLDKLKIPYTVIDTKHTALGNNILCNDNGCFLSTDFTKETVEEIQKALVVPVERGRIADLRIVGACGVANNKGCLLHRDASQEDVDLIGSLLKVSCDTGTANLANPYVSSAIITNSNGFIIGGLSGGPEINHIDEVLGFLKG